MEKADSPWRAEIRSSEVQSSEIRSSEIRSSENPQSLDGVDITIVALSPREAQRSRLSMVFASVRYAMETNKGQWSSR